MRKRKRKGRLKIERTAEEEEEGKIQGLFTLGREREREKLGQINARLTSVPANLLAELGGEKSRACFHVLGDWTQRG